ncbi:MAG: hypothetical protein NPIRA03_35980 [Nitrospirales bacterium]|nr:MAG: hypothetical protein NPIRA03_35980 [Nitrospirales bacterium]
MNPDHAGNMANLNKQRVDRLKESGMFDEDDYVCECELSNGFRPIEFAPFL